MILGSYFSQILFFLKNCATLRQSNSNQFTRVLVNIEEPPAPQVIKLMKVQCALSQIWACSPDWTTVCIKSIAF